MSKELVISALVMLGLDTAYISVIKNDYLNQIQDIQKTYLISNHGQRQPQEMLMISISHPFLYLYKTW